METVTPVAHEVQDHDPDAWAQTSIQKAYNELWKSDDGQDAIWEQAHAQNTYIDLAAERERRLFAFGKYSKNSVEEARQNYEAGRRDLKAEAINRIQPEDQLIASWQDDRSEVIALSDGAAIKAKQLSGLVDGQEASKFNRLQGRALDKWSSWGGTILTKVGVESPSEQQNLRWWQRYRFNKEDAKQGVKGRAMKTGTMGAIGLVTGAAVGTVAGPVLAAGAGAAMAAGAAMGVGRGLMGAKVNKLAQDRQYAKADAQADDRYFAQSRITRRAHETGTVTAQEADGKYEVSEAFREATEHEVWRNRTRVAVAAGVGAVAGALGGLGAGWLRDRLDSRMDSWELGPKDPLNIGSTPRGEDLPPVIRQEIPPSAWNEAIPAAPDTIETTGEYFDVECGNGLTHEIQDFVQDELGENISKKRAFKDYLHFEELKQEGKIDKIIDVKGTKTDLYMMEDGHWGISRPGKARWDEDVEIYLRRKYGNTSVSVNDVTPETEPMPEPEPQSPAAEAIQPEESFVIPEVRENNFDIDKLIHSNVVDFADNPDSVKWGQLIQIDTSYGGKMLGNLGDMLGITDGSLGVDNNPTPSGHDTFLNIFGIQQIPNNVTEFLELSRPNNIIAQSEISPTEAHMIDHIRKQAELNLKDLLEVEEVPA